MTIKWTVDGCSADRAFRLEIPDEDLEEYDDEERRNRYIDGCVEEEFRAKIGMIWEIVEESR